MTDSRPRSRRRLAALLVLAVVACGDSAIPPTSSTASTAVATTTVVPPATTTAPLPGAGVLACQISDFGPVNDAAINQAAWAGMDRAIAEFGITAEFRGSNDEANYQRNIDAFLEQGCDVIITTGVLLAPETAAAAGEHPDRRFAILDYPVGAFEPWGTPPPGNVRGLTFQVDEAAFLAGYLAAGMSSSGVVGTFGGLDITAVTVYMEGFRRGVIHYDEVHETTTTVVGWDGTTGVFTADFVSPQSGEEAAAGLIASGADVIFPVADRAGEGACAAAAEANAAGGSAMVIGKDWDWYLSAPECAPVLLTSVLKRFDTAVFTTIQNLVVIRALGNQFVGTLENDGVGLADFHDLAEQVPDSLVEELEELAGDIAAGRVSVRG